MEYYDGVHSISFNEKGIIRWHPHYMKDGKYLSYTDWIDKAKEIIVIKKRISGLNVEISSKTVKIENVVLKSRDFVKIYFELVGLLP